VQSQTWFDLRTGRVQAVLADHLDSGAYGRGNTPLGNRDRGLESVEQRGVILTGGRGEQQTPQQEAQQQAMTLPGEARAQGFHALILSRDQRTLSPP
jgi:hypothetical protein